MWWNAVCGVCWSVIGILSFFGVLGAAYRGEIYFFAYTSFLLLVSTFMANCCFKACEFQKKKIYYY